MYCNMHEKEHTCWVGSGGGGGLKDMSEMERKREKKRTLGTKLVFFPRRFLLRPTSDIASVRGRVEKKLLSDPSYEWAAERKTNATRVLQEDTRRENLVQALRIWACY